MLFGETARAAAPDGAWPMTWRAEVVVRVIPVSMPFSLPPPLGQRTYFGLTGPVPAPFRSIEVAIASMSEGVRDKVAASIQPSTCTGLRAPTIAPVTPGHASVHATATAAAVVRCCSATWPIASATARLRFSASPLKSALRDRQSFVGRDAARSALNDPLSRPDCIGL